MKKGETMSEISFGSSYKIPVSQWGINNTKKLQLKSLIGSYAGKICGKGQDSFAVKCSKNGALNSRILL